ncbi:MAG: aspartyl/asparaginyl beta-hydroxylase domain-containing protein, partial [Gammaproteobacteria bacterium]
MKVLIVLLFAVSILHVHFRGRVRHGFGRQLKDHSSFLAPINSLLYLTSVVSSRPFHPPEIFPELQVLRDNWQVIREEGLHLLEQGRIRKSQQFDDVGFNSFFRTGWKRFYLKWYGESHPSAQALCPVTTKLLGTLPSVKAAMFAELPPGARLVRHRDPYAGSLRYHLGLDTPNSPDCFIEVDGERYFWRDGEGVIFDETYIHYAENTTGHDRLILFCDVERPLRYRWAAAFNRWFSRNVMAAASSPNSEGDATGGINRAFKHIYKIRLWGKELKKR